MLYLILSLKGMAISMDSMTFNIRFKQSHLLLMFSWLSLLLSASVFSQQKQIESPFEQIAHNEKYVSEYVPITYTPYSLHNNQRQQEISTTASKIGNRLIIEGDIVIGTINTSGVSSQGLAISYNSLWPSAEVYYQISNEFTSSEMLKIRENMDILESRSALRFYERGSEVNFINIEKGSGCWSFIGMIGGEQELSLGQGCLYDSTIQHELMHAVGIEHEQSRPDRDSYVEIIQENIEEGKEGNFSIRNSSVPIGDYDYESIMHYSRYTFSRNGEPTLLRLDDPSLPTGGNVLTATDIAAIGHLYPVGGSVKWFGPNTLAPLGSAAISDEGNIYLGGTGGFYSLRSDGSINWQVSNNAKSYRSSPVIAYDGTIYISDSDGSLNAISPSARQIIWTYDTAKPIKGSVAINGDNNIFFGAGDYLVAVDSFGNELWSQSVEGNIEGSPAIDNNGNIIVATTGSKLYSFNDSGIVNWSFNLDSSVVSSPAITLDGSIIISATSGSIYSINRNGVENWRFSGSETTSSSPVITVQGTIIVGSNSGLIHLSSNGSLLWQNTDLGRIVGTPAISETNTIYVGSSSNNTFYALANDGTVKWSNELDSSLSSAVLIGNDGSLYIQGNKLYALFGYDGSIANSSWPKFGKNNSNTKSYEDYIPNTAPTANAGSDKVVQAGSMVSLDGSASFDSDDGISSYSWEQISGEIVPLSNANNVVANINVPNFSAVASLGFRLLVTDRSGATAEDTMSVIVRPNNEGNTIIDFETADLTQGDFTTEGSDGGWRVYDDNPSTGIYSATSPLSASDGSTSTISLTALVTEGAIQFDRAVSSEESFDYLVFSIDGNPVQQWSGELPYKTESFPVTAGVHTFSWSYEKDNIVSEGQDRVWIDNIYFIAPTENLPPEANAGEDREVEPGQLVVLSGELSQDLDGDIISYSWQQVAGPDVQLDSPNSSQTTFVAPESDNQTALTFRLTVTDDGNASNSTTVTINVIGNPPTGATIDFETGDFSQGSFTLYGQSNWQVTSENASTGTYSAESPYLNDNQTSTLSYQANTSQGSISFDRAVSSEEGFDNLTFYIDDVVIASWSGEKPFHTVVYPISDGRHEFRWTYEKDGSVSSGLDRAWIDNISFAATSENLPPVADAGPSIDVVSGNYSELNGYDSYDPDGQIIEYEWQQIGGSEVSIFDPQSAYAYFNAPSVDETTELTFTLTVTDNLGATAQDTITVTVIPNSSQISYIYILGELNDIAPNSERSFSLEAVYDDGSVRGITNDATWTVTPSTYAYFSEQQPGTLFTENINTNEIILIEASYQGFIDSHYITITGAPVVINELVISGSEEVFDNSEYYFNVYANLSDGNSEDVTSSANYNVSLPEEVQINDGYLVISDMNSDTLFSLDAEYNGFTVSKPIRIIDQDKVNRINITNPISTIGIASSYQFQVEASQVNGNTFNATDLATWSVSNNTIASIEGGLLTISDNIGNVTRLTISVEFEGISMDVNLSLDDNVAPEITTPPVTKATKDKAYYYAISSVDANEDVISLSMQVIPSSLEGSIFNFENVESADLPFTFPQSLRWEISSFKAASGSKSLAAPIALDDNQTSSMIWEVETGAGEISFDVATSTESGFDYFTFLIDDVIYYSTSGENDFSSISFVVDEGVHTFEWRYAKDGSVSIGEDTVWIDNITIPPTSDSEGSGDWLIFTDLGDGNGELFGTPSDTDLGEYTIQIIADDGALSRTQEFTLSVEDININPYDYDGDGKADISIRRADSGYQFIKESQSQQISRLYFGSSNLDIPVNGDFDGDGIADMGIFRPEVGSWFIKYTSDNSIFRLVFGTQANDIPVPADYDGDGITDIAIRRPGIGQWIIRPSSAPSAYLRVYFGYDATDTPVPADYDGDGIDDIAIWRKSTQQWIIRYSSNDTIVRITMGTNSSDIPVTGDYDGDGTADFAVRSPGTGMWHIRNSSDASLRSVYFGSSSDDIPVQADYDGDGKTDIALRRPDTATFIIAKSGANNAIDRLFFGSFNTDIPLATSVAIKMAMLGISSTIENEYFTSLNDKIAIEVQENIESLETELYLEKSLESETSDQSINMSELEDVTDSVEFTIDYIGNINSSVTQLKEIH